MQEYVRVRFRRMVVELLVTEYKKQMLTNGIEIEEVGVVHHGFFWLKRLQKERERRVPCPVAFGF